MFRKVTYRDRTIQSCFQRLVEKSRRLRYGAYPLRCKNNARKRNFALICAQGPWYSCMFCLLWGMVVGALVSRRIRRDAIKAAV